MLRHLALALALGCAPVPPDGEGPPESTYDACYDAGYAAECDDGLYRMLRLAHPGHECGSDPDCIEECRDGLLDGFTDYGVGHADECHPAIE